jgi:hypothetical protein
VSGGHERKVAVGDDGSAPFSNRVCGPCCDKVDRSRDVAQFG